MSINPVPRILDPYRVDQGVWEMGQCDLCGGEGGRLEVEENTFYAKARARSLSIRLKRASPLGPHREVDCGGWFGGCGVYRSDRGHC